MKSFSKLGLAAFALMLFFNAFAVIEAKAQARTFERNSKTDGNTSQQFVIAENECQNGQI